MNILLNNTVEKQHKISFYINKLQYYKYLVTESIVGKMLTYTYSTNNVIGDPRDLCVLNF